MGRVFLSHRVCSTTWIGKVCVFRKQNENEMEFSRDQSDVLRDS